MYSVRYKTKNGGSGVMTTSSYDIAFNKLYSSFKNRLPATIFENGLEIGRVWRDESQRIGWNYFVEKQSNK